MLSKRGIPPTAPCQKILGMEQWGSWNVSMLADRVAGGQPSGAGRGALRAPCHSTGHPDSNPGGARPIPSVEYTPDPISTGHLHSTSPSPSKGTHGAVLGWPLPAEVALHILRREKVTGTDRVAGGRSGSQWGWVLFGSHHSSDPDALPSQSSPGHALPARLLPFPQIQGHTHWFSSRSRVKFELKAGMTKLTWARWTGWEKGGEGRRGVNLGRPEGGNWGDWGNPGSSPGEGMAQAQQLWVPLI